MAQPFSRNKRAGYCSHTECGAWCNVGDGWRQWQPGSGPGREGGWYALFCTLHKTQQGMKAVVDEVPAPTPEVPVKQDKATVAEELAKLLLGGGLDEAEVRSIAEKVTDEKLRDLKAVSIEVNLTDRQQQVTVDGAHEALEAVLACVKAGPVLLVGPAGSGKTTLAEHAAKALDLPFLFNGAIASEYKLTGFVDAGGTYHSTPFRQAFEHGGVYLFDELDASAPQALLAFNAGLSNGNMDFPDSVAPVVRHPNFVPIASANTWGTGADREYVGRNQLDAATIDRFIPVTMDYDKQLEQALAGDKQAWLHLVWDVRGKCDEHKVRHVVSTRAVLRGRVLLESGMEQGKVEALVLKRNLSDDTWKKVRK